MSGWSERRTRPGVLAGLRDQLRDVLGARVLDSEAVRDQHSRDEAFHQALPDLVAFPQTAEEIASILRACKAYECPVTPWGAGTSLEGNALASQGGLCLSLARMDRILSVDSEDMLVVVEAGVRRLQLDGELKGTGLFFPIDPGADATLGGMAATRASGTTAVKYGTMRENVLSCTVVLADGRIVRTRSRAPKSAAGYDLTGLFVGSEGTLGIISDLTLRLRPVPECVATLVCGFDDLAQAVGCVVDTMQLGLPVLRIEFMDAAMAIAINAFAKLALPETATLLVELSGGPSEVKETQAVFAAVMAERGGNLIGTETTAEGRSALWKGRHNALYASRAQRPGGKVLITDVCVPISQLTQCLVETRADLNRSSLPATIAGHVGDGNFHAFICVDPDNAAEIEEAEALHFRMAERAIRCGGTCTGEHGIGLGKKRLLELELGAATPLLADIKRALDPSGILNPDKVFDMPLR
ncbi:D-lactate dehydrogenase [alpha proteobacterium U9-1i]|nr:D-lactate dehydrogenase [alpha proteobacterium U9-1i]